MSNSAHTKRVLCACTSMGCREQTVEISGAIRTGKLVSSSTRSRHLAKDRLLAVTDDCEEDDGGAVDDRGELGGAPTINDFRQSLLLVVSALAAWLHTVCGLSRTATGQVLKVFGAVIGLAMEFGQLLARMEVEASVSVPQDVRTAMSHLSIEPNINRSICCPVCFTKYAFEGCPVVCDYRETKRSKKCGTELWVTRSTPAGPRLVPCRLYNTQDFESWLSFFLSRPGMEDIIDKSYAHRPCPENMRSIWDSPAWRSLGNFTTTQGNLTFSFFIDWFNPFTNKIAGKSVSCGAIMMFCLNLPPELQHLPENTFFAGLTPPPKEPTVTTITAVADPIVDSLESMWHGKHIQTHRHPAGSFKRV